MMQGWMGGFQGPQASTPAPERQEQGSQSHSAAHEEAAAAAQTQAEAVHAGAQAAAQAAHAAAQAAVQGAQAAAEAAAGEAGEEYLQRVGDFVAAALDPLGIDVQVDIESPEGERTTLKASAAPKATNEKADEAMETEESSGKEPEKEKSSDDEEWTVLNDKKDDADSVTEVPIHVVTEPSAAGSAAYPKLPATEDTPAPSQGVSGTPVPDTVTKDTPTQDTPSHPDPKIQVALQAMVNMGFSNDGGWLTNLLEAKDGDIGKVLDILQPVRK